MVYHEKWWHYLWKTHNGDPKFKKYNLHGRAKTSVVGAINDHQQVPIILEHQQF
jgi:hypothetical protein